MNSSTSSSSQAWQQEKKLQAALKCSQITAPRSSFTYGSFRQALKSRWGIQDIHRQSNCGVVLAAHTGVRDGINGRENDLAKVKRCRQNWRERDGKGWAAGELHSQCKRGPPDACSCRFRKELWEMEIKIRDFGLGVWLWGLGGDFWFALGWFFFSQNPVVWFCRKTFQMNSYWTSCSQHEEVWCSLYCHGDVSKKSTPKGAGRFSPFKVLARAQQVHPQSKKASALGCSYS